MPAGSRQHLNELKFALDVRKKIGYAFGIVIKVGLGRSDQGKQEWIRSLCGIRGCFEVHLADPQLSLWFQQSEGFVDQVPSGVWRKFVQDELQVDNVRTPFYATEFVELRRLRGVPHEISDSIIRFYGRNPGSALVETGWSQFQKLFPDADKVWRKVDTDDGVRLGKILRETPRAHSGPATEIDYSNRIVVSGGSSLRWDIRAALDQSSFEGPPEGFFSPRAVLRKVSGPHGRAGEFDLEGRLPRQVAGFVRVKGFSIVGGCRRR
mmetsp:Transcript_17189/g.39712  ORF Transcript_17189/g.39712 Transcript_17189/m.39712 type:complete len:265 (+) Transcript_17189:1427-2221(+)